MLFQNCGLESARAKACINGGHDLPAGLRCDASGSAARLGMGSSFSIDSF